MSNGNTHSNYCRKEKEIAEIYTDVQHLKRIVMEGNGGEALATCVPKLSQNVETLNNTTIPSLQKGISSFLKYQSEQEGKQEGKETVRRKNRWVIGLLVTAILALVGALITTLIVVL
jgi:hypothetical protein